MTSNEPQFYEIIKQLNNLFDDTGDYLSTELKAIIDHRSSNGVLKFKVYYTNGDEQWHHIDLIKDEDPHTTANYIIINDLVAISDISHGRWVRLFLRFFKITLRRLHYSDFPGFDATTFNPPHTCKKQCSRRYAKNNKVPAGTSHKTPAPQKRRAFKCGLEVPKNWKDILRIYYEASNKHHWQNYMYKDIDVLIYHKCFDFKSPSFKPSKEYQYVRLHLVYYTTSPPRHV